MTIAVDIRTGAVVGQVIGRPPADLLPGQPRKTLLLTKDGYRWVPEASVRIEEV